VRRVLFGLLAVVLCPAVQAYSVLTHEAVIDTVWETGIRPLLIKRFPQSTPDDLKQAHAYAYGGCILQDMGYYPFGSKFFSDLVHYVRSGDFVVALIKDSQDVNEYAFALGALAHYVGDTEGHSIAVNPAVALEYPKLRHRFGPIVTYAEDPSAHLKVEFGFDVEQVARGNYAPQAYHDFIGFQVSKPLIERAFEETYGLRLTEVFGALDLALGTYRYTVSKVIPDVTKAAWKLHKDELIKATPGLTQRRFVYTISRAAYRKEWDGHNRQSGIGVRILEFFLRILPKVGPFKVVAFKPPTPAAIKDFEKSFVETVAIDRRLLAGSTQQSFDLPNRDLDTGKLSKPAEYSLADDTYAKLATKLASLDPSRVSPELRQNVLAYFSDPELPFHTKKKHKDWRKTLEAIRRLKGEAPVAGAGSPAQAVSTGKDQ
jgi:hypothetical protein